MKAGNSPWVGLQSIAGHTHHCLSFSPRGNSEFPVDLNMHVFDCRMNLKYPLIHRGNMQTQKFLGLALKHLAVM